MQIFIQLIFQLYGLQIRIYSNYMAFNRFAYSRYLLSTLKNPVIKTQKGKNIVDLSLLDTHNPFLEGIVIVNNILNESWLEKGLKACQNVVIADGGANRLYETRFRQTNKVRAIVGDFDSIKDHVKQFYQSRNVQLQKIIEQDTNDFQKAVTKSIKNNWNKIFCFGAFGGRMDHALSGMSNTSKLCKKHKDLQVVLVGRQNLMYFVRPNIKHKIKISNDIDRKGCGLIRFGHSVKVTTNGLKWNLGPGNQYQSLEWGKLISTSNQFQNDTIQIESSGQLFFTAHFKNYDSYN